jgi:hypothetical protein
MCAPTGHFKSGAYDSQLQQRRRTIAVGGTSDSWSSLCPGMRSSVLRVRRAAIGPGLWPGPRRQARWAGRGLQGQRRAAGASRAAGCGAPLRLEGPARTMRGVLPGSLRHLHGSRRTRRVADRLAVVLAGAAAGYGGDRRRPVTGVAVRGSRRAVGLASEGRGEAAAPRRRDPQVEPVPPTAGHPGRSSPSTARARPRCSRPGPSGPARRRCALEAVEKIVTTPVGYSCVELDVEPARTRLGLRITRLSDRFIDAPTGQLSATSSTIASAEMS